MIPNTPVDPAASDDAAVIPGHSHISRHHTPLQGVLDTENVAALDEVQHEAALRDSALRAPK